MSEQDKPLERAGFQNEEEVDPWTVYVQEISRQTTNELGEKGYFPPNPGVTIATVKGPFVVEEIKDVYTTESGRRYFRASGHLEEGS